MGNEGRDDFYLGQVLGKIFVKLKFLRMQIWLLENVNCFVV